MESMAGVTREQAVESTVSNLLEAELLLPNEVQQYRSLLVSCPMGALIQMMLYSFEVKETISKLKDGLAELKLLVQRGDFPCPN